MLTIVDVLHKTEGFLRERGVDSPRLDAELLLGQVLGLDRVTLYLQHDRPMVEGELTTLRPLVKRRGQREPMALILGHREFWSLELAVEPGVLIPRPDTETLVEAALDLLPAGEELFVADVGTGSGAVAIALSKERPACRFYATDVSEVACRCAKGNVERHAVDVRVAVLKGSLLEPIPAERRVDVVVSNPPYVPSEDLAGLMPEVRDHEPHLALDGGADGLDVVRALVSAAAARAKVGICLEIGAGQAAATAEILRGAGCVGVQTRKDLGGIERVVSGRVAG